jgi:anti-sigma factor ChrR (cupin superfamily)
MAPDLDDPQIHAALAAHLAIPPLDSARAGALRRGLLDRAHHSAVAHREYSTVRIEDVAWQPVAPGVTGRLLRGDASTRVEVLRLVSGATLPWPEDAHAQEILVLQGALAAPGAAASCTGVPGAVGYCVRQRQLLGEPLLALADATVYVRHLLAERTSLPDLEARWWEQACASTAWVDPGRRRWRESSAGVDVLPLRGDSDVVSMLVRFAAGASVPDHAHALDEDCLVLQGEMFLGDILLRTGDYQLAPAGGSHFGETSDVGVLFFFHGALDPVLKGQGAAQ